MIGGTSGDGRIAIRAARKTDTPLVFDRVRELAIYEKLGDTVDATIGVMDDWKICRLSGPALQDFAAKDERP